MLVKNNVFRFIIASTLTTALSFSPLATAETTLANASVVVQNSFVVAQTTPLSFGTIVAFAENNSSVTSDTASLLVNSDGVTADTITNGTLSKIIPVVAATVATFTVSGAAPNTLLTITLPAAFDLTDPSLTDSKDFRVSTFTTSIVTSGSPFTYDTDGGGNMVFNMGATLTTDATLAVAVGAVAYSNVTFTNTYTMTVNY